MEAENIEGMFVDLTNADMPVDLKDMVRSMNMLAHTLIDSFFDPSDDNKRLRVYLSGMMVMHMESLKLIDTMQKKIKQLEIKLEN